MGVLILKMFGLICRYLVIEIADVVTENIIRFFPQVRKLLLQKYTLKSPLEILFHFSQPDMIMTTYCFSVGYCGGPPAKGLRKFDGVRTV